MAPILYDLISLVEEWDYQDKATKVITVCALDATSNAFYSGKLQNKKADLTLRLVQDALRRVPDAMVYPSMPGPSPEKDGRNGVRCFQHFTSDLSDDYFVKRPKLRVYTAFLAMGILDSMKNRLLEEAKAFEAVSQAQRRHKVQPHPAIIAYHGCIIQRGFITGIVLDCVPTNLRTYYEERLGPPLSRSTFMRALKSAVQHIHSLGLAHNNIHCGSVRVSASGLPILSDFVSCHQVGRRLQFSARTLNWSEQTEDHQTSEFRHDIAGLEQVDDWIAAENQKLKDVKKRKRVVSFDCPKKVPKNTTVYITA